MWTRSIVALVACVALSGAALRAQRLGLPPGPMQEKARDACLPCHDARIIVQQRLDRRAWTKNMDKMIRWGAPVAPEDREPLIDYFTQHFGAGIAPSAPIPSGPVAARRGGLAAGAGALKARAACLGCHDAGVIAELRLDRRGLSQVVDRMVRWGAAVPAADREALLRYLVTRYGPPVKKRL